MTALSLILATTFNHFNIITDICVHPPFHYIPHWSTVMSCFRPAKCLIRSVCCSADVWHAHAHHLSHVLHHNSKAELVQTSVKYHEPQVPCKQPCTEFPKCDSTMIMDTNWIDVPIQDLPPSSPAQNGGNSSQTLLLHIDKLSTDSAPLLLNPLSNETDACTWTEAAPDPATTKTTKVHLLTCQDISNTYSTTGSVLHSGTTNQPVGSL